MKFFKWLGKSREREKEEPLKYRDYPPREVVGLPVKVVGDSISFGTHTGIGGRVKNVKPSPITFYPPIEEKEGE